VHTSPSFPLFELVLPASALLSDQDAKFHPRPEIAHVLRPPRSLLPVAISGGFAGLALAPYLSVAFLVRGLPFTYPFAATLIRPGGQRNKAGMASRHQLCSRSRLPSWLSRAFSYVTVLLCYRVALRLGDVLLYRAVLGPLVFFTGQQALVSLAERWTDQACKAGTAYIQQPTLQRSALVRAPQPRFVNNEGLW
jgi:hypothetical protein